MPRGDYILLLALADERNKNKVIRIVQLVGEIIRQYRNALLSGDHHKDALGVARAEENVRLVACVLVKLHEECVAVGIVRSVGRHIQYAFALKIGAA